MQSFALDVDTQAILSVLAWKYSKDIHSAEHATRTWQITSQLWTINGDVKTGRMKGHKEWPNGDVVLLKLTVYQPHSG